MVVASHLLLLLKPPYPQPVLKSLLAESYPTLVSYSQRVYDLAFTTGTPDIKFASMSMSVGDFLPTLPTGRKMQNTPSAEDVHFRRMRWGFFGLVAGAFATYLAVVTRDLEIKWVDVEDGDSDAGDEDSEGGKVDKRETDAQRA